MDARPEPFIACNGEFAGQFVLDTMLVVPGSESPLTWYMYL
jgi:hypothetical protein